MVWGATARVGLELGWVRALLRTDMETHCFCRLRWFGYFIVCISLVVLLFFSFSSLSVYRGTWSVYVVAWHCTTAKYLVQRIAACVVVLRPQSLYLYARCVTFLFYLTISFFREL